MMEEFFKAFRELPRGGRVRDVLTIEWMTAVQDALKALAQGRNITVEGDLLRNVGMGGVRLGARRKFVRKGGGGSRIAPLTIVSSRPSYIPEDPTPVAEGSKRFWITWGTIGGKVLDNWNNVLDVSLAGASKFIALRLSLSPDGGDIVQSVAWETWNTWDEKTNASSTWSENGSRPSVFYIVLGSIQISDGVATIVNSGGGSIMVAEHVSSITQSGAQLIVTKSLHYTRLAY